MPLIQCCNQPPPDADLPWGWRCPGLAAPWGSFPRVLLANTASPVPPRGPSVSSHPSPGCFPYSVMPTEQMSKPPALRGSCQEWDTSTPFRQTPKLEKAFPWKSTPTAFVGTTLPLWAEEGKPQPALQGWPHCTPVGLHATSSHSACFLSGRPGKGKASGRVQPFP